MAKRDIYQKNWYIEFLTPNEIHMHGLGKIVKSIQTKFQDLKIIDTLDYGRCIFLDGKIQSAELDEFIYHEALVHPALFLHPKPERIFVAGGGEGAVLREILKHPAVKEIVMVDIDKAVTDCAKKYLYKWHKGSFRNRKVKLVNQDAKKFLSKEKQKFDCIFIDICDPVEYKNPSAPLFKKEFINILKHRITENGLVVIQSGSANVNMLKGFYGVSRTLKDIFNFVYPYFVPVSSFVGPWVFQIASQKELAAAIAPKRKLRGPLKFYSPEIHRGLFAVPPFIKKNLK